MVLALDTAGDLDQAVRHVVLRRPGARRRGHHRRRRDPRPCLAHPGELRSRRREAGEIELSPPTWITLHTLTGFAEVATALDALGSRPPEHFATRICVVDGGVLALYAGDAGYEVDDPDRPGPRHRLAMMDTGWTYERDIP